MHHSRDNKKIKVQLIITLDRNWFSYAVREIDKLQLNILIYIRVCVCIVYML